VEILGLVLEGVHTDICVTICYTEHVFFVDKLGELPCNVLPTVCFSKVEQSTHYSVLHAGEQSGRRMAARPSKPMSFLITNE
jgi:hypothetical protein